MPLDSPHSGLLADLYELTMAAGYFETHFQGRATFELFVRTLPARRNFLVAAGLEQALEFLESVNFRAGEIDYLRKHPAFAGIGAGFFDYLASFRFSGDVLAMPEGTLCFPGEPLLRVTAPIAEAQIVETALLATMSFQTMIASKAARVVEAAAGRPVIEFGARRAHGIESGVLAARAAYIGGCLGTSNVQAGRSFGIPTYGTQAHSWIMAYEDEEDAFARFLNVFPRHSVLLLDTYDVRKALEKIIAMGRKPRGVRLDSGDVGTDSRWVRQKLDEAGWGDVEIFISGRPRRGSYRFFAGVGSARGHLRRGDGVVHIRRCAIRGHALQAGRGGARRPRAQRCKAQRGQSHVSGPQAGLPHFGRDRPPGRRRDRSRKRTASREPSRCWRP